MPENNFDIYQTEDGYIAVTNEVRRAILHALGRRERGLPELVKITGKAKPTLSSVHMKELLAQKLIEELTHPTDNRKKIYRLKARRIGSSNVPVGELRSAVRHYAALSPLSARLPLAVSFDALAAAPDGADPAALRAQARRLGTLSASLYSAEARDLVTGIATFLEQEGLARPLRLDLENHTLEMEITTALPADTQTACIPTLVAGFLEGLLRARGLAEGPVDARPLQTARRFELRMPPPSTAAV